MDILNFCPESWIHFTLQFVNADLIAAGLSPVAPEAPALQAGRLMLTQIADHVAHGRRFALETMLSDLGYARQTAMAGAGLCGLSAFFLVLPSAEMVIARVAQRVKQPGRTFRKQ